MGMIFDEKKLISTLQDLVNFILFMVIITVTVVFVIVPVVLLGIRFFMFLSNLVGL